MSRALTGIACLRRDGSLRAFVTICVVEAGGDLCMCSAYGAGNGWFSRHGRRVPAGSGPAAWSAT